MSRESGEFGQLLSRRSFIEKSAAGAAGMALAGGVVRPALAASRRHCRGVVRLPSAAQFRAEVQRMVDFGPRLPGSLAHNAYVDWVEHEFVKAGLELLPAYEYPYRTWQPKSSRLEILDGPSAGQVAVAFPMFGRRARVRRGSSGHSRTSMRAQPAPGEACLWSRCRRRRS